MIATQRMTSPKNGSTSGNCGNGHQGAAEDCCQLDCLVQPRFFCGQLLTDQDLGVLVDWTKDKARLARFRHGWGVICGLEVRGNCASPAEVRVEPGYALSCCGHDIVVCSETSISLADVCREEPDPCAGLRPAAEHEIPPLHLGDFLMHGKQVRVADLYIGFREVGSDPQAALPTTACTSAAPCEFTRTKESFVLTYQVAIRDSDPQRAAVEEWVANYHKCLQVVEEFVERGHFGIAWHDLQRWLLGWIDSHPLNQFCFLKNWICSKDVLESAEIAKILFWMVQDYRNVFLACDCYQCHHSPGVPLARVWMQLAKDSNGKPLCSAVAIDSDPPYRRLIQGQCWPAPLGHINLAPVIWRRAEEANAILHRLGVSVAEHVPFTIPEKVTELLGNLKRDSLVFSSGDTLRVHTLDAGKDLGTRVVAVSKVSK